MVNDDRYVDWNPCHRCTKISPGCKYCYVYRQDEMYGSEIIGCTVENQEMADYRLPIFKSLPIVHKSSPSVASLKNNHIIIGNNRKLVTFMADFIVIIYFINDKKSKTGR